jgi:FHA domain
VQRLVDDRRGCDVRPFTPLLRELAAADRHDTAALDKRLIPLPPGEHVIGRAADALVSVASDRVSRRHALIVVTGDTAAIQNLDSKNGTYVGATRIDRTVDLKNGDRILVGPAMLIFRARPDDDSTASARRV